jgi:SAM-dependent methyltransferase
VPYRKQAPLQRGVRTSNYQLGSADDELARLELQGRALAQATRMIFDAAGIRPGMRVLDLGCGTGDVAFVAADSVGPDGYVLARVPMAAQDSRSACQHRLGMRSSRSSSQPPPYPEGHEDDHRENY